MSDIRIDHDGPRAPYLQLADALRQRIEAGDIPAGRRIPSEADIQLMTGLARATIRRAVALLVREGLVHVVPRRGTYVNERADAR